MAERRAYGQSVLGSTVERLDTTGSDTSTVDEQAPSPLSDKPRPTGWGYQIQRWWSERKTELLGGLALTVLGWLCHQYFSLNREVGVTSSRIADFGPKLDKIDERVSAIDRDGATVKFQLGELWEAVFKNRRSPAIQASKQNRP